MDTNTVMKPATNALYDFKSDTLALDKDRTEKLKLMAQAQALKEVEIAACRRGYNRGILRGFVFCVTLSLILASIFWYAPIMP